MKRFLSIAALILCSLASYGQGTYTLTSSGATLSTANPTTIGLYAPNYFALMVYDNIGANRNSGIQATQGRRAHVALQGTTTSFIGNYPYDQAATGALVGWSVNVACHYNAAYGCTGGAYNCSSTVTANTAASQGGGANPTWGAQVTFSPACSSAISGGDIVLLTPPGPTIPLANGWGLTGSATAAYDTTPAHQLPAIGNLPQPAGCYQVTNSGSSTLSTLLDTTTTESNLIMNGVVTQSITLSLQSGSVTVTFNAHRGGTRWTTGTQTVSGSAYTVYAATPGTAAESGATSASNPNPIVNEYDFSGTGVFCVGGTSLTGQSVGTGAHTHTNGSVFSDQFAANIKAGGYGGLRYNYAFSANNIEVCQTIKNLVQPLDRRQPCNSSQQDYVNEQFVPMGLYDLLDFCVKNNIKSLQYAIPWWTTTAEDTYLSDFLFGSSTTTVGGQDRAALGHPASFATDMTTIILSHNETWNSASTGQYTGPGSAYYAYLSIAEAQAVAIKATPSWNNTVGKYTVSVQQAQGPANVPAINAADTAHVFDYRDESDYYGMATTTCTQPAMFQNSYAEAYGNVLNPSTLTYQSANAGFPTSNYETASGAIGGACTPTGLAGVFSGLGSGMIDTLTPALLQQKWNNQYNFYSHWNYTQGRNVVPYTSTGSPPATTSELWSSWANARGWGANPDGTVYASLLFNTCAKLGHVWSPTASGVPTVNVAAGNGIPAQNGIPLVPALAYTDGGTNRCYIWWNLDSTSHTVALTGADVLTGTITQGTYSSPTGGLNDNNRTLNTAPVVTSSTTSATGATSYTLPAYSMLMLSGSTTGTTTLYTVF